MSYTKKYLDESQTRIGVYNEEGECVEIVTITDFLVQSGYTQDVIASGTANTKRQSATAKKVVRKRKA